MSSPIDNSDAATDLSKVVVENLPGPSERQKSAWPSSGLRWAAFVLIALLGLLLRLPQLGERPMHTDEAVNAYIVGQLLAGQSFVYDPRDRHGPSLAAFALPLVKIRGAKSFSDLTESELRLTSVMAGSITILLFGVAAEIFGFVPCMIAAILFAVAPLSVYYDRYFIHEPIFVAATFGLILSGWRAWQRTSGRDAALAGACAALMLATKETAVLHFVALTVAAFLYWLWEKRGHGSNKIWKPKLALVAAATFLIFSVLLFTWFGSNWKAPTALLQAAPNFLARAGGEGHQGPVWYYARLLTGGWSGGAIIVLSGIGLLLAAGKRCPSIYRFLAYYSVLITIIYSLIPYKTPWLALNFWLPIALFAGAAFESQWRMPANASRVHFAKRAICVLVGVAIAALIFHDTRHRVFLHPADEDNPYAYAHTSEDLLGLPAEIERLARQNAIAGLRIAVIASDPWPLPWYLRHIAEVGFWQPGQQPGRADFYITSTEAFNQYGDLLKDFRPQYFGARPGVLILLWSPAPK